MQKKRETNLSRKCVSYDMLKTNFKLCEVYLSRTIAAKMLQKVFSRPGRIPT